MVKDVKFYPVIWTTVETLFDNMPRGMAHLRICICGYSHRIWKYVKPQNVLSTLVVTGIRIEDGVCMDSLECLDFDCRYNRATAESLCKLFKLKKLPDSFKCGQTLGMNKNHDDSLRSFDSLFAEYPQGGYILSKK